MKKIKRIKNDPVETAVDLLNDLVPSLSCKKNGVDGQFRFHFNDVNDEEEEVSVSQEVRFAVKIKSLLKNVGFTTAFIEKFINAAQCTGYVTHRKNSNLTIREYIISGNDPVIQSLSSIALSNKPQKSKWDFAQYACAGVFTGILPAEIGANIGLFLLNERKKLACVNKAAYFGTKNIENTLDFDEEKTEQTLQPG